LIEVNKIEVDIKHLQIKKKYILYNSNLKTQKCVLNNVLKHFNINFIIKFLLLIFCYT